MTIRGFSRVTEDSVRTAMCYDRNVAVIPLPTSPYAKTLERERLTAATRMCPGAEGWIITAEVIATSFPLLSITSMRNSKCLVLHARFASLFPVCTRNSPINSPVPNFLSVVLFSFFYTICYH